MTSHQMQRSLTAHRAFPPGLSPRSWTHILLTVTFKYCLPSYGTLDTLVQGEEEARRLETTGSLSLFLSPFSLIVSLPLSQCFSRPLISCSFLFPLSSLCFSSCRPLPHISTLIHTNKLFHITLYEKLMKKPMLQSVKYANSRKRRCCLTQQSHHRRTKILPICLSLSRSLPSFFFLTFAFVLLFLLGKLSFSSGLILRTS